MRKCNFACVSSLILPVCCNVALSIISRYLRTSTFLIMTYPAYLIIACALYVRTGARPFPLLATSAICLWPRCCPSPVSPMRTSTRWVGEIVWW